MAVKYPTMFRSHVLIKTKIQTESRGGIALPSSAIENIKMAGSWGEAVAVGKDVEEIKVGDTVLPKEWVGNYLDEEGFDKEYSYKIVDEMDILCKR